MKQEAKEWNETAIDRLCVEARDVFARCVASRMGLSEETAVCLLSAPPRSGGRTWKRVRLACAAWLHGQGFTYANVAYAMGYVTADAANAAVSSNWPRAKRVPHDSDGTVDGIIAMADESIRRRDGRD